MHEAFLWTGGPKRFWFSCSCGWTGPERMNVYGASIQWDWHMIDYAKAQIRDAVARGAQQADG